MLTKMMRGAKSKWDLFLPSAVFMLNARKHTVTGFSPHFLCYGFEPRLPQDIHPPIVFNLQNPADRIEYTQRELMKLGQARGAALYRSQQQAKSMRERHGRHAGVSEESYPVGSFVKLKNNVKRVFDFDFHGPFIVDRIGQNHSYYLKSPAGVELKNPVNQANLEPYTVQESPVVSQSAEGGLEGEMMLLAGSS
jgi:hypothetical protein